MKRPVILFALALALLALALPTIAIAGTYTYQYSFGHDQMTNASGTIQSSGICYSNGHVFAADAFNDRIVDFYADGRFYQSVGSYGTGAGQLDNPIDVSVGTSGTWVSEEYTPKIIRFPYGSTADEHSLGSAYPTGLVVDGNGFVWVCTTSGLRRFATTDYSILTTIPGNFTDLTQAPNGNLLVTDYVNDVVLEFTYGGAYVGELASYGAGLGQVNGPWGISVAPEGIVVADMMNDRVQILGSPQGELPQPPDYDGFDHPTGIAVGAGKIFVSDDHTIRCYSTSVEPPSITLFSPTAGLAGAKVTITGQRFAGASAVGFNGVTAAFTLDSDTQITATVPAGATTGPITVVATAGSAASTSDFVVLTQTAKVTPVLTKSPPKARYTLTRKRGVAAWTYKVTLRRPGGAAIGSKTVQLQKSTNGTKWTTKYTLTTNASGVASKKLKFRTRGTTYWRWNSPAATEYEAASASKTKIIVR